MSSLVGMPAYRQIYEAIRQQISGGLYSPGAFLPTEPELEKQFNVSRITVRKAVDLLRQDGLVEVRQGRGTTVTDPARHVQVLNRVTSFSETLRELGMTVSHRKLGFTAQCAGEALADELKIDADETVLILTRLVLADGTPIAVMQNALVARYFPGFCDEAAWVKSLYRFLEKRYALSITSAVDTLSARLASSQESEILELPLHAPLLINHRVTSDARGPFESMELQADAMRYKFQVFCNGRPGK